jgi:uncharacterized membrane protein
MILHPSGSSTGTDFSSMAVSSCATYITAFIVIGQGSRITGYAATSLQNSISFLQIGGDTPHPQWL